MSRSYSVPSNIKSSNPNDQKYLEGSPNFLKQSTFSIFLDPKKSWFQKTIFENRNLENTLKPTERKSPILKPIENPRPIPKINRLKNNRLKSRQLQNFEFILIDGGATNRNLHFTTSIRIGTRESLNITTIFSTILTGFKVTNPVNHCSRTSQSINRNHSSTTIDLNRPQLTPVDPQVTPRSSLHLFTSTPQNTSEVTQKSVGSH